MQATLLAGAPCCCCITPVYIKRNDNGSRGGHIPGKKNEPHISKRLPLCASSHISSTSAGHTGTHYSGVDIRIIWQQPPQEVCAGQACRQAGVRWTRLIQQRQHPARLEALQQQAVLQDNLTNNWAAPLVMHLESMHACMHELRQAQAGTAGCILLLMSWSWESTVGRGCKPPEPEPGSGHPQLMDTRRQQWPKQQTCQQSTEAFQSLPLTRLLQKCPQMLTQRPAPHASGRHTSPAAGACSRWGSKDGRASMPERKWG